MNFWQVIHSLSTFVNNSENKENSFPFLEELG